MQSLLANKIKLVKYNSEMGRKFPKEVIPYLLKALKNADNVTKNDIENQLVKIGEAGIPVLVNELGTADGVERATIAMVLIRLGYLSIEPLKNISQKDTSIDWIVKYIINEIEGSKTTLNYHYDSTKEILVG